MVLKEQEDREIKPLKNNFRTSQLPSPSFCCDTAPKVTGFFDRTRGGVLTFSPYRCLLHGREWLPLGETTGKGEGPHPSPPFSPVIF